MRDRARRTLAGALCGLLALSLAGCGPDPIVGEWRSAGGGGLRFRADGTCWPVKKYASPFACRWKKLGDGEYEISLHGDVGAEAPAVFHFDGNKLTLPLKKGRKPFVLVKAPAN